MDRERSDDAPTAPRHTRRLTRAISIVLALVLLALAGLALTSAYDGERSAARLERSGDLAEAYLAMNQAFATQEAVEARYDAKPTMAARARFEAATAVITRATGVLQREGPARDRRLAATLAVHHARYVAGNERAFDAVDAGDRRRAEQIDDAVVDPAGTAVQQQVSGYGPQHAALALRELDQRKRSRDRALQRTLVVVGVGLATIAVLSWLLAGLRRRLEQATAVEFDRLAQAALTDSVTGIRNHRAFQEDLGRAVAAQQREDASLSVVMFDADRLKEVNERGGHQAGDEYLESIATALMTTAGHGEGVYRIGGDEFAAILPGATSWDAFAFAQRVHATLSRGPATVTAGVAEALGEDSAKELVQRADLALMDGKRSGQATVRYSPRLAAAGKDSRTVLPGRHALALGAALARAVDAKDSYTRSHCETVAALCDGIATELGLAAESVAAIRLAGLVHDVGKIGVPDAILQKPAALSEEEYSIIKGHCALGHKILIGTDLERQAPWVLHHHERIDGDGYPDGLAGDDIPLGARIIHVADAFEAMTSDRPYRPGMSDDDAIVELLRHVGTQFDGECVAALLRSLGRGGAGSPDPTAVEDERPLVSFARAVDRLGR